MEITLEDVASGLEREINVPRREICEVCNGSGAEPGTQPKEKIILKSRGIIELNGYRRGDHIINIDVKIPAKLTKEEIILLKKYADGREEAVDSGSHGVFSNIKNAFKK